MSTTTFSHPFDRLTKCVDCGKTMSWTADRCVRCGSENRQVHPLIERLANHIEKQTKPVRMKYTYTRDTLQGRDDRGMDIVAWCCWAGSAIGILLVLVEGVYLLSVGEIDPESSKTGAIFWDIGRWGMVLFILGVIGSMVVSFIKSDIIKTFVVRVEGDKVHWESNDDAYWGDIKWYSEHPY